MVFCQQKIVCARQNDVTLDSVNSFLFRFYYTWAITLLQVRIITEWMSPIFAKALIKLFGKYWFMLDTKTERSEWWIDSNEKKRT